jgi:hypothetical protein
MFLADHALSGTIQAKMPSEENIRLGLGIYGFSFKFFH